MEILSLFILFGFNKVYFLIGFGVNCDEKIEPAPSIDYPTGPFKANRYGEYGQLQCCYIISSTHTANFNACPSLNACIYPHPITLLG